MNKIYWGDNLQVISHLLKVYRGKIDLIYIDPPFDSKADYKKKISLREKSITNDHMAFEEKQYTDIWNNDEYLQFMFERLIILRELLSEKGSIYLHCDYRKSHLLRCLLDEIFGKDNIVNEVIWHYRRWSNVSQNFQKMHDNIFIYSKTKDYIFNLQYQDYANSDWIEDTVRGFVDGKLVRLKDENGNYIKREKDNKGVPMHDVWEDINFIGPTSKERLEINYPTQKPRDLLERIIKVSSNQNDIVFDCFMGSGTTQEIAMKLGRRFIGADINLGAIQTTIKRLLNFSKEKSVEVKTENIYTGFEVYNVNNYDFFRNPVQAKEILIKALEIQPLPQNSLYDGEKDGKMVKIMPINRIATKADLKPLITGFDFKKFEQIQAQNLSKPVLSLMLICMGHEPNLAAELLKEVPYKIDIEVVDIHRNKAHLQFKHDSEAEIGIENDKLIIKQFYPMNLLSKLSLEKEKVLNWRELVDSIMIDFNYDGAVLTPSIVDVPEKNDLVIGTYNIPADAGIIKVKITDLLSESFEMEVNNG
jgi:DNA modification methylase